MREALFYSRLNVLFKSYLLNKSLIHFTKPDSLTNLNDFGCISQMHLYGCKFHCYQHSSMNKNNGAKKQRTNKEKHLLDVMFVIYSNNLKLI